MKLNIEKSIRLKFEIDSSEAIMFCKGGRLDFKILNDVEDGFEIDFSDLQNYQNVIVSFQMTDKGRFEWITSEAAKARQDS